LIFFEEMEYALARKGLTL